VTSIDDFGFMSPHASLPERAVLETLDALLQSADVRAAIDSVVEQVARTLAVNVGAPMAWRPIPLDVYGRGLPAFIQSSWVFILRAGATTGAERHPNSHQRMMSYRESGDLQTGGDGCWQSHHLISNRTASLEQRWCTIPINVWHQAVVGREDWVVVSFHTVPANELIEERPGKEDANSTRQRYYLSRPAE
jgi:hypothetical protein